MGKIILPDGHVVLTENPGRTSDGYHTFDELYEHRHELFITLCRWMSNISYVWRSRRHADGSFYEGWFVLGIRRGRGYQISYHVPIDRWDDCEFADEVQRAFFDGHTSQDVLQRLKRL